VRAGLCSKFIHSFIPLAHPRALPAAILSDRRSPSAMCDFPFQCLGCRELPPPAKPAKILLAGVCMDVRWRMGASRCPRVHGRKLRRPQCSMHIESALRSPLSGCYPPRTYHRPHMPTGARLEPAACLDSVCIVLHSFEVERDRRAMVTDDRARGLPSTEPLAHDGPELSPRVSLPCYSRR